MQTELQPDACTPQIWHRAQLDLMSWRARVGAAGPIISLAIRSRGIKQQKPPAVVTLDCQHCCHCCLNAFQRAHAGVVVVAAAAVPTML